MAVSFIVGGNRRTRGKPLTCRNSLSGVEPTTSVVIGTDCIGSCKSNYYMILATTAPEVLREKDLEKSHIMLIVEDPIVNMKCKTAIFRSVVLLL